METVGQFHVEIFFIVTIVSDVCLTELETEPSPVERTDKNEAADAVLPFSGSSSSPLKIDPGLGKWK